MRTLIIMPELFEYGRHRYSIARPSPKSLEYQLTANQGFQSLRNVLRYREYSKRRRYLGDDSSPEA